MKKLLLLLLILPTTLLSQTYNELMSIDSLDDFKKVMIENQYEFYEESEDGELSYVFNVYEVDSKKYGEKYGSYFKDGSWKIQFNERNTIIYKLGDYDDIVEEIKKCDYVGIEKFDKVYNNNDYVTYNCNEDIDGKIGFMITNSNGYIRYFPNKE
tara:strand:- start:561 stop:1025 length:465 start_codon:yes stop_codon:yes gene_type:complete